MPRDGHPKKEIAEALRHARHAGLTVSEIHRGHGWGEVRCLCGFAFAVWSTPRNPGVHARQIMRFVAMHADHLGKGPVMTSYQFRVRLDREPTEPEIDALGAVCDDAGLSYGNGLAELDFDRDASSFADAVFSAIADVEGPTGLQVTAVDADPLVSVLDIAERTGRSREAVRQAITGLRARRFPPPVNGPGARHRLWRWSEVAAFYGLDDDRTRQAARVADAANGWLALRRSAPGVAPSADAVAEALRAA